MSVRTPILTTSSDTWARRLSRPASRLRAPRARIFFWLNICFLPLPSGALAVLLDREPDAAGPSFCNHSMARVNAAKWLKANAVRHLAVYFRLDSVHTRHGHHPTPAGFAYPARCGARGVAGRLEPVAPVELPLAEALGCVAAEMPPLKAFPPRDIAAADGWALRARDLVGASSYSPLPLASIAGLGRGRRRHAGWLRLRDRCRSGRPDRSDGSGAGGGDTGAGRSPRRWRYRRGWLRRCRRAACPRARSIDRARGGTGKTECAPPAPAHRQYSRGVGQGGDGAIDRGKRPRGRRRV